jgi:hypothetical protein
MTVYKYSDDEFKQNGMGIYFPIAVLILLVICLCINIPILIYKILINHIKVKKKDPIEV